MHVATQQDKEVRNRRLEDPANKDKKSIKATADVGVVVRAPPALWVAAAVAQPKRRVHAPDAAGEPLPGG